MNSQSYFLYFTAHPLDIVRFESPNGDNYWITVQSSAIQNYKKMEGETLTENCPPYKVIFSVDVNQHVWKIELIKPFSLLESYPVITGSTDIKIQLHCKPWYTNPTKYQLYRGNC